MTNTWEHSRHTLLYAFYFVDIHGCVRAPYDRRVLNKRTNKALKQSQNRSLSFIDKIFFYESKYLKSFIGDKIDMIIERQAMRQ